MVTGIHIITNEKNIFTNEHYIVPLYQRGYAWEEKHIVQLIDDIMDVPNDSQLLLSAKHSDLKFDLLICRTADYIHVYPHVYRRKNCLLSRNQANWGTFQST